LVYIYVTFKLHQLSAHRINRKVYNKSFLGDRLELMSPHLHCRMSITL